MEIILLWIDQNVAESIAIFISLISLTVTTILSKREKPNIMPYGNVVSNGNHLSLDFLNTSNFNIHDLTILINGFNSDFNEIKEIDFSDKYLFSIGEKTSFNYGFNLNTDLTKNIYFRVRVKGLYNLRVPFLKMTTEQSLWYSIIPLGNVENEIVLKILNTHRDEIKKIQAKHSVALRNYERSIDVKFE